MDYSQEDEDRVRATRAILLPRAEAIAGAVYSNLLVHPETAGYFSEPGGEPDGAHLQRRAETLMAWLRAAIESPLDEETARYLASVGRAHTRRSERMGSPVKGRYLLTTVCFVQTALIGLLDERIPDRQELLATIAAWNKLLMIHLDLFLAVYSAGERSARWY